MNANMTCMKRARTRRPVTKRLVLVPAALPGHLAPESRLEAADLVKRTRVSRSYRSSVTGCHRLWANDGLHDRTVGSREWNVLWGGAGSWSTQKDGPAPHETLARIANLEKVTAAPVMTPTALRKRRRPP